MDAAVGAPPLQGIPEVAKRLGKSEAQMRWMIHTGDAPPSAKIGGRRMFRTEDVEAWIDEQFARAASA